MTRAGLVLSAALLLGVAGCASVAAAGSQPQGTPATGPGSSRRVAGALSRPYTPSDEDFPNPERGFYRQYSPFWLGTQRFPLDDRVLAALRQSGISLIRAPFVIDEFVNAPLSREALDAIAADFAAVRRAGVKIIPRFAYNSPTIETFRQAVDAPLARVLGHIDQLAPILNANSDVIAFMEAGFIGAWGEWHDSSNGLLNPDRGINSSSAAIVNRLLGALPATRMLALRNPFQKQGLFGLSPLTRQQAFGGTPKARVGAHNDCFASDATDSGTYLPPPRLAQTVAELKRFLSEDNRFVPQGGESCGSDVDSSAFSQPYVHCANAMTDLAMMRWSTINIDYHPMVIALWQQEGCLSEMRRRLGYRLRLVEAELPTRIAPGRQLSINLTIANDGWASPYNPRLVEIVLRHSVTGRLSRFPVDTDPRFWGAGETHSVELNIPFPVDVEDGDHEILLNLPDPERGLYGIPEYSIRLANVGLWEPQTGFNNLRAQLTVAVPGGERRDECGRRTEGNGELRRCVAR